MNKKRHTGMGLGICMLAGILLFHPIVAGVDILPDLLGYLLLYVGLARLSDLNGHINEARRRFRVMLFVGAGQIFATYIVYGMIEGMMQERPAEMSAYEGPMLTLLFTFVLLVLQWFFLIPAWKELFLGLGTMAERFHCTELMHEHRGKTRCERLASLSAFFVVTASLLSLLPEASVLTSYEAHKGNPLFPFDWFEYVVLFRTAACAVSAIVGLIWLISYLRCLAAFRRNRDFIEQAVTAYETEILPQTGMLTVRRFRSAFLLFTVGSVFAISIRVNNRALLPGVVFAVFVIVGCVNAVNLTDGVDGLSSSCSATASQKSRDASRRRFCWHWSARHSLSQITSFSKSTCPKHLCMRQMPIGVFSPSACLMPQRRQQPLFS